MTIIVTIQPTICRDDGAMGRLIRVLEVKIPATLPEIAHAILTVSETIKTDARMGLATRVRMWRGGPHGVCAEVVP